MWIYIKVVKRAIRASVEQYSLKAWEAFHGFQRIMPLEQAGQAMRRVQHMLEMERPHAIDEPLKHEVAQYNADDCFSTRSLRSWMERERGAVEANGMSIARPISADGAPSETLRERQQRITKLTEELVGGISADRSQRTEAERARWLLANLLDWHRRENKLEWCEFYRLRDLTDEELVDEKSALAGLEFLGCTIVRRGNPVDRYRFEEQETDIRAGDKLCERGAHVGEVVAIDIAACTINIKRTRKTLDLQPTSVFVNSTGPNDDCQAHSLFRLGVWVKEHGLEASGPYQAARDLLLCRPPRLSNTTGTRILHGESIQAAAKRICASLSDSVLPLQGPPGAGKTFTGARIICDLVRQGKKIGVTACSHKVIRNLLDEILIAARQEKLAPISCLHKVTDQSDDGLPPGLEETTSNAEALAALESGAFQVVAGTAWLWSREEFFEKLDLLFVDEAGQMSLADTWRCLRLRRASFSWAIHNS